MRHPAHCSYLLRSKCNGSSIRSRRRRFPSSSGGGSRCLRPIPPLPQPSLLLLRPEGLAPLLPSRHGGVRAAGSPCPAPPAALGTTGARRRPRLPPSQARQREGGRAPSSSSCGVPSSPGTRSFIAKGHQSGRERRCGGPDHRR